MLAPKMPVGGGQTLSDLATQYGQQMIGKTGQIAQNIVESPTGQVISRGIQNIINQLENIPNFSKQSISHVRDYAGNKVLAIRGAAKQYWKQEVNAYGEAIDELAGNKTAITGEPLMEKMTQEMINRGLYDPINDKWVTPLNKVDSQFLKSYTQLARQFTQTGKLNIGDVVKEYQNIKNSAPIGSSLGREAYNSAYSLINTIKDQIDIDIFKTANARYTDFRNNFDQIDRLVNVWGEPLRTGTAEKFLTHRLGETAEARRTAQMITKKTGQTLRWAKALSALRRFPGMKWIMR